MITTVSYILSYIQYTLYIQDSITYDVLQVYNKQVYIDSISKGLRQVVTVLCRIAFLVHLVQVRHNNAYVYYFIFDLCYIILYMLYILCMHIGKFVPTCSCDIL